ncbi:uncharacterized protein ATNIH1004_004286 [Aspergillus tanneri]|uniref:Uncharacterized protein n=1 Tax=Aspergillus tanneri TaxID=1220188 RepID=A0A5M9MMZ7_9EURO|nr:uncharacterized protein ATNIH1004_004286 [Aspergillus tanneri]KAA8648401.1 hypothetical protein ATNIH1004_004286 [Aspergillus tanneri]
MSLSRPATRGFKDATKSKIKKEDREETYQVSSGLRGGTPTLTKRKWIKRTLTEENLNEDTKKQKFPLGKDDTGNTVASLWRRDSPSFMQGFLKVLLGFALQVYLFTWARIGAFIPAAKHRKERGLRYMEVLFGINTLEDLAQFNLHGGQIPEIPLR